MNDFTLTMLDSSGIQKYVFGSNRLQENIGASELVYQATTSWVFRALDACGFIHNVSTEENRKIDDHPDIEKTEDQDAEVVYAGGGNTMLIFRNRDRAVRFTQRLTRRVLKEAPGLTLAVRHVSFNMEKDWLPEKRRELVRKLASHKQAKLPSTPMLGLGVTAVCESTGLPATRNNVGLKLKDQEETRLICPEIEKKLRWRNRAMDRLNNTVGEEIRRDFVFPSSMDELGRIKGAESHVAVIHADGNGMGIRMDKIADSVNDRNDISESNRIYIQRLRDFSNSVNTAGINALKAVVMQLVKNCQWNEKDKKYKIAGEIPLDYRNGKWMLPFRPLVFGGDDVTFVCNGQLGVSLAAMYLRAFEKETEKQGLDNMHACAGIAIVKSHYPFARAYALSEELCGSAKKMLRGEQDCSALDWHFAQSGLSGSLGAIRKREYLVRRVSHDGKAYEEYLTIRPVRLNSSESDQTGRYWEDGIERVINELKTGEWKDKRNKIKGLYAVLREGGEKTKFYRKNFGLPLLPELIPGASDPRETGWSGRQCIYFDAIELMDHYVPLAFWEDTL